MHVGLGGEGVHREGRSMSSLTLARGKKYVMEKNKKKISSLPIRYFMCGEWAFLDWDEATRNNIVASYGQMARQTVVELLLFFL